MSKSEIGFYELVAKINDACDRWKEEWRIEDAIKKKLTTNTEEAKV